MDFSTDGSISGKDDNVAIFRNEAIDSTCNKPGRPKLVIPEDTLLQFRELFFTWSEIASLLMVSRWTLLQRRVNEYGIKEVTGFSNLNDNELGNHIKNCQNSHGKFVGRSIDTGYLRSLGIRVQQNRIRKSLVRVDPKLSKIRWACQTEVLSSWTKQFVAC